MADGITLTSTAMTATDSPFTRFAAVPSRTKIMFGIGVAAIVAIVAAASMWTSRPDYKVLYANLADRDGGAVIAALAQLNIPYKSEGGNVILVPADKVHDARFKLAAQGLPKGGIVGLELLDNQKMGATQFQEQVNFQRGLEGELARSIQTISAVQGARVHLAIPKPSVFLREQQKPTASVLVNLYPGKTLDPAQLAGIVHLISSSVPELTTKNVSVVDQSGTLLSKNDDNGNVNGLDPSQLEYVKRLEQQTQTRIATILEPILGRDNYRVQVNADVDFSQSEQSSESYKPNGDIANAALRSQQINESNSKNGAESGGVPGALTNQPAAAPTAPIGQAAPAQGVGAAAANTATDTHKESIVNYEVDKTTKVVRGATGMIKRLSAAVVVNHRVSKDSDGVSTSTPLTEQEIAQLNALVREAMGFSKDRGDSLNVSNVPFSVPEKMESVDIPMWKDPANLQTAAEFGKWAALVLAALILVRGFIKPALEAMKGPATAQLSQSPSTPQLSTSVGPDAAEIAALPSPGAVSIDQARELAKSDPRAVANVVKNWVGKE
ncbi:flagellar basal-body MS-ring/collar protein FliF [soil metagenome]